MENTLGLCKVTEFRTEQPEPNSQQSETHPTGSKTSHAAQTWTRYSMIIDIVAAVAVDDLFQGSVHTLRLALSACSSVLKILGVA